MIYLFKCKVCGGISEIWGPAFTPPIHEINCFAGHPQSTMVRIYQRPQIRFMGPGWSQKNGQDEINAANLETEDTDGDENARTRHNRSG